jgi:hypothetical protein
LKKQNIVTSKRRVRQIIDKYKLISNYTVKQYKIHKAICDEEKIDNILNRDFDNRSDLEIVGCSSSPKKDTELVYEAFMNTNINLTKV